MDSLIERIKNLKEFEVTRELPENFRFFGKVPYDCTLDAGTIKVKVWGVTLEEAEAKAEDFIAKCTDEEL